MPFSLAGFASGFADPSAASSGFFNMLRDKKLNEQELDMFKKKKLFEQEQADKEADKAEEKTRQAIASTVGSKEIAPGVTRPAYTNAAMMMNAAKAAPYAEGLNKFTTASALSPYAAQLAKSGVDLTLSEQRAGEAESKLRTDEAEMKLGNAPLRKSLFESTARTAIGRNTTEDVDNAVKRAKGYSSIALDVPGLQAAADAAAARKGEATDNAELFRDLPRLRANSTAKRLEAGDVQADADIQAAKQSMAIGQMTPEEQAVAHKALMAELNAKIGAADTAKIINAIKTGAFAKAVKADGSVDFEALGVSSPEIVQTALGIIKASPLLAHEQARLLYGAGTGSGSTFPRPMTSGTMDDFLNTR